MYLPLYNESQKKYFIKIPSKLCFSAVSAPLFAFITCVVITMYKDFESANNTHCKVPNIFPSISASIGNYEPQSTIWKIAIYGHAPIRFYLLYLRWNYYRSIVLESCVIIVKLAVFLNIIENITLVGLTHWTSSRNYSYHEVCFKTFIGTSVFYMLLTCIMLSKLRRRPNITYREQHSVKLKWRAFFVNITSFASAAYFFLRHNSRCEPYSECSWCECRKNFFKLLIMISPRPPPVIYNNASHHEMHFIWFAVYSMFGLSEYIVVISNIVFHLTTAHDLQINFICITSQGIVTE